MSSFGRKSTGGLEKDLMGRKHHGGASMFGRKAIAYGKKLAHVGGRAFIPAATTAAGALYGGPVGASVGYALGDQIARDL